MYSFKFLKSLVNELTKLEKTSLCIQDDDKPFIKKIGCVNFSCPIEEGEIDIYTRVSKCDVHVSYMALAAFKDGRKGIMTNLSDFVYFTLRELESVLIGGIAHELGHHLAGHLLLDPETRMNKNLVDMNAIKIKSDWETGKTDSYIRSTVVGVLRSGCLPLELEADLIGIKFVGLGPILSAHCYDLDNNNNLTVGIEKINRLSRLVNMVKTEKVSIQNNYRLSVSWTNQLSFLKEGV